MIIVGIEGQLYYVIYTDEAGNWRIQCVPVATSQFENRLDDKLFIIYF